jgi:tetratricopeptide (TPR) repeat protein
MEVAFSPRGVLRTLWMKAFFFQICPETLNIRNMENHPSPLAIAFLEGNPGRAARLLGGALISTMSSGDTGGQIRFLEMIGNGFEEVNRHSEGLRFFERAIKLADAEPDSGLPFMAYEGKAQALAALGKPDEAKRVLLDALGKARLEQKRGHQAQLDAEARQTAAEALKLAPTSQGVEVEVALVFAMAGETARAESLAQDLGKRFPLDTQMQSLWLPAIQAQSALDRKNPASALNALQAVPPIELGKIGFVANISCLYHVYVRGEAYLAAGQGSAAAAEFQKIINHSGIVWNCWTGALAHLGVARANALQARTAQGADADAARVRALAAYKDFLTLWKDADPDIPIMKQAKAEYAKLQ